MPKLRVIDLASWLWRANLHEYPRSHASNSWYMISEEELIRSSRIVAYKHLWFHVCIQLKLISSLFESGGVEGIRHDRSHKCLVIPWCCFVEHDILASSLLLSCQVCWALHVKASISPSDDRFPEHHHHHHQVVCACIRRHRLIWPEVLLRKILSVC